MLDRGRRVGAALGVIGVCLYLFNASWRARPAAARVKVLAHRGVHQRYVCPGLAIDGCSAACMADPTHDYLENTIRSMRAAFELGADVVELDIHPTTDGEFAVFHDFRVECRTNGTGVTRERSMAYLKTLDIGHGYTADQGKTFPFRGRGVGQMPTLTEALDAFPWRRFLIHFKSDDPAEADLLARALLARPEAQRRQLMVYGGERPIVRLLTLMPELRALTRASVERCGTRYALVGWSGYVPAACRNTLLLLPESRARLLWGWPHRFIGRMENVGTPVFVVRTGEDGWIRGIDDGESFTTIARDNYSGGVWTDRAEIIGPLTRLATRP